MSTTENEALEQLRRAIEDQQEAGEALQAELARRAGAITEGKRRGKTWDETKREILGKVG